MKLVLLIVVSYVIGFFTAIPIGATQVEIAKRSISGYFKEALMVVAGSATSDLMYGFLVYRRIDIDCFGCFYIGL